MDWLSTLFSLITLVIGWSLSELSKSFSETKNDKKKIRRLLFNMLELRWLLKKEIDIHHDINNYIVKLKSKLSKEVDNLDLNEIEIAKSIILKAIKNNLSNPDLIKKTEHKIDETIEELAGIFPLYAYELTDINKIKSKLDGIDKYLDETKKYTEEIPQEIKDWMKPRISSDLLKELNHQIIVIARKVSKKTVKEVQEILYQKNDNNDNDEDLDNFLDDYVSKINRNISFE